MFTKTVLALGTTVLGLSALLPLGNSVQASTRVDRNGNLRGVYDHYYIVRSPDGALSCNPGAYVSNNPVLTYRNGAKVLVKDIVLGQYDSPWILTQNGCYVRANVKYLY